MKTPYAILIGLALIAAAIFYREPSVKSAQAGMGGADGFLCRNDHCYILDGNYLYTVILTSFDSDKSLGTTIGQATYRQKWR
jgi:hypothetical protein